MVYMTSIEKYRTVMINRQSVELFLKAVSTTKTFRKPLTRHRKI